MSRPGGAVKVRAARNNPEVLEALIGTDVLPVDQM